MDSEKWYLKIAKKLGNFFLLIWLLVAIVGIYQGYMDAHHGIKSDNVEYSL
jgi:hypothetical protein